MKLVNGGVSRRCYTYIDDAIECCYRIVQNPGGVCDRQIFNIGSPHNELSIRRMAEMALSPAQASHVILTALRRGIISSLQLPHVCRAWEEPAHEQFLPRTAWSLFNAFTSALKQLAPIRQFQMTARLGAFLERI